MRVVVGLVVISACGRIDFDAPAGPDAAPSFARWSAPMRITAVASNASDWEPAIRFDNLVLVFSRYVDPASDLYVATRTAPGDSFGAPSKLALSSGGEASPFWSIDGTELYFTTYRNSSRPQLWVAAYDGSGFGAPAVVPELASEPVMGPVMSSDELELYYSDDDVNTHAIRRATRSSTTAAWVVEGLVPELNSGKGDGWPTLSPDGLTLFFESSRDSAEGYIYMASRASLGAPFQNIVKLDALDDGVSAGDPDLSPDGQQMWFGAERTGGSGGQDIYVAMRLP